MYPFQFSVERLRNCAIASQSLQCSQDGGANKSFARFRWNLMQLIMFRMLSKRMQGLGGRRDCQESLLVRVPTVDNIYSEAFRCQHLAVRANCLTISDCRPVNS